MARWQQKWTYAPQEAVTELERARFHRLAEEDKQPDPPLSAVEQARRADARDARPFRG